MDCPDCGGPLDSYVLDGREASICERCGWVGIEADHRGEGAATESWDDALDRFYERHVTTERRRSNLPPVAAANGEATAADDANDADDPSRTENGDVAGLIDEAEPSAASPDPDDEPGTGDDDETDADDESDDEEAEAANESADDAGEEMDDDEADAGDESADDAGEEADDEGHEGAAGEA